MTTKTIEQFFTGKSLEIPAYQRDYAWSTSNIDDLFDDIAEAMETDGGHYLGTFILSATNARDRFKVVDGQQRLTTLTMLLDAIVDALPDGEIKTYYRSTFLRHPIQGPKFSVLGTNQEYFLALLDDGNPQPASEGQKRMKIAYEWIRQRVREINGTGGVDAIKTWLVNIGKLEVLEFIEKDEGKAIRMFQSVNDRGVPLAKMDIAKSLLIYYSNRFLAGELDRYIFEHLGAAFCDYSRIKDLAGEDGYKIRLIDRNTFREDDIFRYHYFSYNPVHLNLNAALDFNATSETVLEAFLKPTLKQLRADPERLRAFIKDYVADLAGFFAAFRSLIEATRDDKSLYMLFVVGDLAATLYPLTIRLSMRKALREPITSARNLTLLEMIETADLRVFKLRGTNPQADILNLTRKVPEKSLDGIANFLRWFIAKFMDDGLFESRIRQENVYRNPGLVRIFCAVEEMRRIDLVEPPFSLDELAELSRVGQTIEHILPQQPSFNIQAYGFDTLEEYEGYIHRIGNLTLMESALNGSCSNQSVEAKITGERLYRASAYRMTVALAARCAADTPMFSRDGIEARGSEMATFCVGQWPLW